MTFTDVKNYFIENILNSVKIDAVKLNTAVQNLIDVSQQNLEGITAYPKKALTTTDPADDPEIGLFVSSGPGTYTYFLDESDSPLVVTELFAFFTKNGDFWDLTEHAITVDTTEISTNAVDIVYLHNKNYIFQGFVNTATSTPATHVLNYCWMATESGTIFGITAKKGDLIVDNGTAFINEMVKSNLSPNQIPETTASTEKYLLSENLKDTYANFLVNTGYYVNTSGGLTNGGGQYKTTPFINVEDIDGIYFNQVGARAGCYYDKNYVFIADSYLAYSTTPVYASKPEGAVYFRTTYQTSGGTAYFTQMYLYRFRRSINWLKLRQDDIRIFLPEYREVFSEINAIDYDDLTSNYYMNTSGELSSNVNYSVTGFIDVENVKRVKVKLTTGVMRPVCFFDAAETFISGTDAGIGDNSDEILVPSTAKYVRHTLQTSSIVAENTALYKSDTIKLSLDWLHLPKENIDDPVNYWAGKKIVWLGTSIPKGVGSVGVINYPKLICDWLGATLVNTSLGSQRLFKGTDVGPGYTASGATAMTIAEHEALPAWSGDVGYHSYENIFTGDNLDADLFVFDVVSNNIYGTSTDDWDLFDFENWEYTDESDFVDHRETYLGAFLFLVDILLTERPNANIIILGWKGNGNALVWQQTKDMAEALNCNFVDVWSKFGLNHYNMSLYAPDGVHLAKYGHWRFAEILRREFRHIY